MPDKKISDLDSASALSSDDLFVLINEDQTRKTTLEAVTAFVTASIQDQLDALVGGMQYKGVWNANTNSPTIVDGTGTLGDFYKVSVAGSTTIDTNTDWHVGDWISFNGTVWDKVDNYEAITSVFGRIGAITAQSGDYDSDQVTEGSTNLYFTDERARAAISGTATGLDYSSSTGELSLASGYLIPTETHDANLSKSSVGITLDGNGGVIAVNTIGTLVVPFDGTITGWQIMEISSTPVSSSIVVDVWKDTYANYPPTVGDAIFTTLPTLSSAIKNRNLSPTFVADGAVTSGDILKFNVDSVSSALKVQVIIFITRN